MAESQDASQDASGPSLAPATVVVSALCLAVTTLAILFRNITKAVALRSIHLDDCLAIFAWACFVGFTGYLLSANNYGAGQHTSQVPIPDREYIYQVAFVLEILWCPLMLSTRLSVCVQLTNIFCGIKKGYLFWILRAIMIINTLLFTMSFFMVIWSCAPISSQWIQTPGAYCVINVKNLGLASALWNIISDILVFVLPVVAVWRLKLPTRKRLGIAAIFATAFFSPVSSVFRLFYAIQYALSTDPVYSLQQLALWSLAEVTIYIACGFMPLIPKFLQLISGRAHTMNYDPNINSMHQNRNAQTKLPSTTASEEQFGTVDEMTLHLTELERPDRIARLGRFASSPRMSEDTRSRSKSRHSFLGSFSDSERRAPRILKTVRIETQYETPESLEAMRIENWT